MLSLNLLEDTLLNFDFPQQATRKNVMEKGQLSYSGFVVGMINSWAHADKEGGKQRPHRRDRTKKYHFFQTLATFVFNQHHPEFPFTTIQVNKNQQMKKHKDGNNVGESYIVGVGDYQGGELIVYDEFGENPKKIDIKHKFYKFNGSIYPHETAPFTGDRITLVFFSI
tara:strand:- start:85 stop:588 length:504 start_codon:yes stop_codon:yes gene_type:complete